jgi:uncharacterized membrane protein YphA (DoxX/SURF4 family)
LRAHPDHRDDRGQPRPIRLRCGSGAAAAAEKGITVDLIVLVGRVLFSAIFISSGIAHLRNAGMMGGYAQSKGVPAARLGVVGSGALILAGGLSVLLGVWPDLGALLILVFLVPTAVLMLFAFFAHTDDLGLTVTGPLFDLG